MAESTPEPTSSHVQSQKNFTPAGMWRLALFAVVLAISLSLGLAVGYDGRTPEFNPTSAYSVLDTNRTITVWTDLLSVDAIAGSMVLDWTLVDDTACNATQSPPCPGPNSTVDFYFDANILTSNLSPDAPIPSDNIPSTPIFRHNATAVASQTVRNSLAAFRTELALFSTAKGRSTLSTLQRYPFDQYTAQIFMFALDSQSGALVGLKIGAAYGIAVGFKTTAERTVFRGYPGVISEVITVSRSVSVQAYAIVIVIAVWLITLLFMFATVNIFCGYNLDNSVLVVPVATLFAITQLRSTMPGAPAGFGAIVDFVGLLPCLALMSFSASLTIGFVIFDAKQERDPFWLKTYSLFHNRNHDSFIGHAS